MGIGNIGIPGLILISIMQGERPNGDSRCWFGGSARAALESRGWKAAAEASRKMAVGVHCWRHTKGWPGWSAGYFEISCTAPYRQLIFARFICRQQCLPHTELRVRHFFIVCIAGIRAAFISLPSFILRDLWL